MPGIHVEGKDRKVCYRWLAAQRREGERREEKKKPFLRRKGKERGEGKKGKGKESARYQAHTPQAGKRSLNSCNPAVKGKEGRGGGLTARINILI